MKFMVPNEQYANGQMEVVVNPAHIVRIEPRWHEERDDGKRFDAFVQTPNEETLDRSLMREFVIFDSLGNEYSTENVPSQVRDYIEKTWLDAIQ